MGPSPTARPRDTYVPTAARVPTGGHGVNTALVDSLVLRVHPSAAWCPLQRSPALSPPPLGRPLRAPAAPPAQGAPRAPQRAPGRAAGHTQSAHCSGGQAQALPTPHWPGARPLPGRKELPGPTAAAGPPCAAPGSPPRSHTHSPALGDCTPKGGGGPTLAGLTCEFGPAARSAPWLPSGGGRRDPSARPAPPRPVPSRPVRVPPFSHLGPAAACGRTWA